MHRIAIGLLLSGLTGCMTHFWGSAKVPDGPKGCKATCDRWGMELAGMVSLGEYSDGCICQVKPKPPAAGQAPASEVPMAGAPSAAVIPAAAGVHMQMAAAAAAAAQQGAALQQSRGTSWHTTPVPAPHR